MRVKKIPSNNILSLQNYFQINWETLLKLWNNLLEQNFADLGHVFAHWVN